MQSLHIDCPAAKSAEDHGKGHRMINRQEAMVIAECALDEMREGPDDQLAFFPGDPQEWGDHYIFTWNSVDYLKSRNVRDALCVGPLIVRRSDGAFVFISSGDDTGESIKKFDEIYAAERKRHTEKLKGSR